MQPCSNLQIDESSFAQHEFSRYHRPCFWGGFLRLFVLATVPLTMWLPRPTALVPFVVSLFMLMPLASVSGIPVRDPNVYRYFYSETAFVIDLLTLHAILSARRYCRKLRQAVRQRLSGLLYSVYGPAHSLSSTHKHIWHCLEENTAKSPRGHQVSFKWSSLGSHTYVRHGCWDLKRGGGVECAVSRLSSAAPMVILTRKASNSKVTITFSLGFDLSRDQLDCPGQGYLPLGPATLPP